MEEGWLWKYQIFWQNKIELSIWQNEVELRIKSTC